MDKLPEHVKNVCKIGQGPECCKYLTFTCNGPEMGWTCEKTKERNKQAIDAKWATEEHVAQGDNCEGKSNAQMRME